MSEANKADTQVIESPPPPEAERFPSAKEPERIREVEAVLEKANIPQNIKELIVSVINAERIGPSHNPIFSKMTPAHISKVIEITENADIREHSCRRREHFLSLGYFLVCLGFVVFLILLFKSDLPFLKQILVVLLAFIGGGGAVLGLKSRKKSD